ncbi:hypothetical protein ACJ41O_006957 [Fusarium nematophilum]
MANHTRDGFQKGQLQKGGACDVEGGALPPSTDMSQKMAMELQTKAILKYGRTAQQLDSLRSAEMDVHDWQASRIRNSRFLQDGDVKPWPWSFQVKIIGTAGSGRHSLLDRICFDEFTDDDDDSFVERDSGCRQTSIRGLTCNVWFEIPISLTSHGDGHALTEEELFFWLTHGMRDCDALMLVYDLTDAKSFELLCEFCARCVYQDVGIASLPCLVVGTKCDLPDQVHVYDGERLARRLGGRFVTCSSRTGSGIPGLVEAAVGPVADARTSLMRESEDALGEAVRTLMTWAGGKRMNGLTAMTALLRWKRAAAASLPRPMSRATCTGAPPWWTMRTLSSLPLRRSVQGLLGFEPQGSDATLEPCPPEYQLSMDLLEPATRDWAPKF